MLKQNINYQQIFRDILDTKCPEKKKVCIPLLQKVNLSAMDIVKINTEIFGISRENETSNQKHRSYHKSDILRILDYQKKLLPPCFFKTSQITVRYQGCLPRCVP